MFERAHEARSWAVLLAAAMALPSVACVGSETEASSSSSSIASADVASLGRSDGSEPSARGYAMMADLPGGPEVVLLGGASAPGAPDLLDMWTFGPQGWRDITPASLPELPAEGSGVIGNLFEFDRDSEVGIFVDIYGHVWVYDPAMNTWRARVTVGGPDALLGASMVYDAGSDRMILFGGLDLASFVLNRQTWAYDLDANEWERMHPRRSPSQRNYRAMAYDEGSDRVILFGGATPNGGAAGDTWAYDFDGDSWTRMSPATPPPARTYGSMVYDSDSDQMILFGGSKDQETGTFDDTWSYDYDNDSWTQLEIEGPSARGWHAMAFERKIGQVVLLGGGGTREAYTNETWVFDPLASTWSRVS